MQRDRSCYQCSHWGRLSPDEPMGDCNVVGVCYLTVNIIETRAMFTCVLWRSREEFGAYPPELPEAA